MDVLKIVPPEWVGSILVAVSGGADSVALLALLRETAQTRKLRLTAAHFEHGIRAETSLADAAFVRTLCDEWGIPLIEGSADVPALARERRVGLEQAARDARYEFLNRARIEAGVDLIALAHHQDDQVETVLMHLLRGSGLHGMTGMRQLDGVLYRPLLGVEKKTLVCYLREWGIPWREDATNQLADNPRNALRLRVIPEMERIYPGVRQAVRRFSEIAAAEDAYMEWETGRFLEEYALKLPFGWMLNWLGETLHEKSALALRGIRRLTGLPYDSVKRIVEIWEHPDGVRAVQLEGGWRAEPGRNGLYLIGMKWQGLASQPLPPEGSVELPAGLGCITARPGRNLPIKENGFCQEMDEGALLGAVVRTRQSGDVIYPLGAPGRQKLSDYFINRHIDRPIRDLIPLVAKGNEILWVAGVGISETAKLRRESGAVRLTLTGWPLQRFGGKSNA